MLAAFICMIKAISGQPLYGTIADTSTNCDAITACPAGIRSGRLAINYSAFWPSSEAPTEEDRNGDVNSDGAVDISDIMAIVNVISGASHNPAADVNNDKATDISDIVAVIHIIAKGSPHSPTPFELHKTIEAGVLTPLCLPVDCSTDDFDELFSIGGIDEQGKAWIYPAVQVPAGTPFVARCKDPHASILFTNTEVMEGKTSQMPLPWFGGAVKGNFDNYSWQYTTVLDSVKSADNLTYNECNLNKMDFDVTLENIDVRRFLAQTTYDFPSGSMVEQFCTDSTVRRDIPNPVSIPIPKNGSTNLTLSVGSTPGEGNVTVLHPLAGEEVCEVYNLIPQQTYYYTLTGDGQMLAEGMFHTKGHLRMIYAPSVHNIRDLGGWPTENGHRVKYGKIYRGGELNGKHKANEKDIATLKSLGITAEIDLRDSQNSSENFKDSSAFGFTEEEGTFFFADAYDWRGLDFGNENTQSRLKQEVELIIRTLRNGGSVYFHCVWGADRTGFLAFLIEGVLGVTTDSFFKDFELTSFSDAGPRLKIHFADRPNYFDRFEGTTLSERCANYLHTVLGISQDDIDFFRQTMLE